MVGSTWENDYDQLSSNLIEAIRQDDVLVQSKIDDAEEIHCQESAQNFRGLLCDYLGDDWYIDIPTKYTSEYKYFCKIFNTVKQGFERLRDEQSAIAA